MRPSGAAAASVGLWVLVTGSVVADPGVAEPQLCLLSHYRWLDPRALAAVKELRDHYKEETELEVTQLLLPPREGSPMDLDLPVGCMRVLMLMTTVLTMMGAVPVPTPLSALPGARGCPMAQFKSLAPQDVKAFKRAKDALEESLLLKNWSCSSRPFPRTRDLRQLQVWERPVALEAELALTLKVLEAVAVSSLGDILAQPLHTLRYIHTKLQACVPAQATAGPRSRGHLHHWLHRLQEASKKESTDCLEASVTFNLFHLLTHDLKCVASGDLCV